MYADRQCDQMIPIAIVELDKSCVSSNVWKERKKQVRRKTSARGHHTIVSANGDQWQNNPSTE